MKNTVRAHRNGGQNRIKPQSQNQPAPATPPAGPEPAAAEFALPEGEGHPACLCIYDRQCRELVSKIPLSETEFSELMAACARTGEHPQDVIAAGVRIELARLQGRMPSLIDIGDNLDRASGLLHVLLAAYDNVLREDGGEYDSRAESKSVCFFVEAVHRMQEQLETDWEQLRTFFHPAAARQSDRNGKAVAA